MVGGHHHINNLNNYIMNWRNWMVRFRGVAMMFLPNHLAWYRFMEQNEMTDQAFLREAM